MSTSLLFFNILLIQLFCAVFFCFVLPKFLSLLLWPNIISIGGWGGGAHIGAGGVLGISNGKEVKVAWACPKSSMIHFFSSGNEEKFLFSKGATHLISNTLHTQYNKKCTYIRQTKISSDTWLLLKLSARSCFSRQCCSANCLSGGCR